VQIEPRVLCPRCRRPPTVCYCAHITEVPTKTKVVLLQHPREKGKAIGTAFMASLCLPNSKLYVGIHFDQRAEVVTELSNPAAPAVLLYPGASAKNILTDPPQGPVTLVVVDGTWAQAKLVVRDNPMLAALPRYAFAAPKPSEYRIRKEPSAEVVSTIESLMYSLGAIEGNTERFTSLLQPFRTMVDTQLTFNTGKRQRKNKRIPKVFPPSPALLMLRERADDIVCVVGEANAWPYQLGRHRERDELAHWLAIRISTGETFSMLAQPSYGWSPSTAANLALPPNSLDDAEPRVSLYERFANFIRPTDIVCGWSWYSLRLYGMGGHAINVPIVDVRKVLEERLRTRVARLDVFADLNGGMPPLGNLGRGGQRLAVLADAVRACIA
jgi:DTW domain-containing protein